MWSTNEANQLVDIGDTLDRKVAALRHHESQFRDFAETERWLRQRRRGARGAGRLSGRRGLPPGDAGPVIRPARRAMVLGLALAFLVSTLAAPVTASRAAAARAGPRRFSPARPWSASSSCGGSGTTAACTTSWPQPTAVTSPMPASPPSTRAWPQAVGLTAIDVAIGSPRLAVRPPEARSPDDPAPRAAGSADTGTVGQPRSAHRPAGVVFGPVLAREVPGDRDPAHDAHGRRRPRPHGRS